jgi:hypothetical protein
VQLQGIESTAGKIRRTQEYELSGDQKYDGADENPAVTPQQTPQIAIQVKDCAMLAPGLMSVMHGFKLIGSVICFRAVDHARVTTRDFRVYAGPVAWNRQAVAKFATPTLPQINLNNLGEESPH